MKRIVVLSITVVAVITVGCSRTERTKTQTSESRQGGAAVGTGGAGANVKSDEGFVHDVASMNMAEIELSRMAVAKASSPDVKLFAQKMIDDHGAIGDKLKIAATGSHTDWPAAIDDKQRKTLDELAKKQGADFDHEYAEAMVHSHQDLVARLESRLDVQSLGDWKAAAAGRAQSKDMPDPKAEMPDVQVRPEKSDNAITMKINQWAADTYPLTQKHLDTAGTLESATKKRLTH